MSDLYEKCSACEAKRRQLEAESFVYPACPICNGKGFVPIAKDAVIVDKARWERVGAYAASHERYVEERWDMMGPSELKRGDLDPLP